MIWPLLGLLAVLPVATPEIGLAEIVKQAPVIVVARVADPRLDVQDLPMPGDHAPPFQRMRRHLDVVSTLQGHAPKHLRVDEPRWAEQYAAEQACARKSRCEPPVIAHYRGDLSREPVPGQTVVVFLRPTAQGDWELAADFALDRGERASEITALLKAQKARR